MSPAGGRPEQRLADLRADFDRSFGEPLPAEPAALEDLLAIRVGGDPYAVRLSAVAGLLADRPVTPLPGPVPEMLGVAGVRGSIAAVYDLAALLGYARSTAPRWLVLAGGKPTVALAFDALDGHIRVSRDAIAAAAADDRQDAASRTAHTGDVVRVAGGVRAVIDIPAVRAAIIARAERQSTRPGPDPPEQRD